MTFWNGEGGKPDSDPEKIHLRLLPFGSDRVRRNSARADFPMFLYIFLHLNASNQIKHIAAHNI